MIEPVLYTISTLLIVESLLILLFKKQTLQVLKKITKKELGKIALWELIIGIAIIALTILI